MDKQGATSGNVRIDHGASKHTGWYRPDRFKKIEEDYQKYVIQKGRTIPRELWYGTAQQESTLGKNIDKQVTTYMAHPSMDTKYKAILSKQFSDENKGAWKKDAVRNTDYDAVVAREEKPSGELYHFDEIPKNKIDDNIANQKAIAIKDFFDKKGFDPHTDYAAYKLQEGLDRYKGDSKMAAWYYNSGRGTKQYEVPEFGKNIINNPRVREIIGLDKPKSGIVVSAIQDKES